LNPRIRHITTYRYKRPVAFGEHRMMLRPRDDNDQKVLESGIDITPKPTQLSWTRDAFGNHVATALFAERASDSAQAPREAIPLQGTWLGDAADHLTMKVAVKVSAATS
jgi:transglutaminase-like putative cysteine protease